jgi:hypothetical protein
MGQRHANGLPRGQQTREGEMTMGNVSRRSKRPRERVATPAELAEDRRRCLAAKAKAAPAQEGNLCACLVTFAAWRTCNGCGARVLFVNEQARTTGKFACGRCDERREAMGEKCKPSLPARAALHLWGSFSTNDNGHEARA